MALGKPRSARRSSSSSSGYCSSTITMLVFIVFCVLALWMLTSSSFPSHTNTSTTTRTSKSNSNPNSQIPKSRNKEPPVFPDTQGDLPDDAIKGDTSDHKSVKETIMDTARDPEVTAAAEQVDGKNDDDKDKGDNKDLNVDVKEQQSESESNDNAGKIEETQQAKEEAANEEAAKEEENQNQAQKDEESKEAQQAENTQTNTEEESKETQQEESGENTQQNQQENAQQNQQETGGENTQNQQQETESTGQTEQTTETENQESTQQTENQQETDSSETTQQSQQETENQQQNSIQEVTNFEQQQQQQLQEDAQQQPQTTTEDQTQQQTTEESTQAEETNQNDDGSTNHEKASGIPKESTESKESWSTQENQSENQKERRKEDAYVWELCNVTAGADFIPCLDNEKALEKIHGRQHYEHRERHCPEEGPTCLVPLPLGYKKTIEWPKSRDKIWYHNVPHTKLAQVKGHQNWVKVTGEFLTFPGGGTQFIHGALHYIDFIEKTVPSLAWGKRTRVILDVGCGVASFGGFLFDRDVLTMSFAPKDEHEAQVQFALERGIPAISAVMGTQRLLFPGRVFDVVHCARCRVPWHIEGGKLLLELNRVLRPGGFFVWSATPVYQKLTEDVEIWKAMSALTKSMCWELVKIDKDRLNGVGAAIYRKPVTNECYENRKHKSPPMCKDDDDANAAWYVPLQACLHKVPTDESERGARWPEMWPARVHRPPYWLSKSQKGIYGKSAPDDFAADYEHWKQVTTKTYMGGLDISWSNVRNVMDMRAVYGGFAAALKDLKVWVMNVVNVDGPDTLPIIYERGLFGIYHDWCESFSTYPRTYDLLHADHLFSSLQKRCNLVPVIAEVDRIVRPGGKFIVRDEEGMIVEIEAMLKSLHWEIHLTSSKDQEGILSAVKTEWRPQTFSASF